MIKKRSGFPLLFLIYCLAVWQEQVDLFPSSSWQPLWQQWFLLFDAQLPLKGQPMHFAPLRLALITYLPAAAILNINIKAKIRFSVMADISFR